MKSPKDLSELSDQELLAEAGKMKKSRIFHGFLIGFMIGVVIYSIAKNTWGLVTLIPLYLIYRLTRKSGRDEELKAQIRKRNLKSP